MLSEYWKVFYSLGTLSCMRLGAEIPAHRETQLWVGGLEDTYSLVFLQLSPQFLSKQNTVYTNAHHTGSLVTHTASK